MKLKRKRKLSLRFQGLQNNPNSMLEVSSPLFDTKNPHIMGVLNITPDSFSDGGRYTVESNAIAQAEAMVLDGAAIIDIGGESTRPGAQPVSVEEELGRVIPVIKGIRSNSTVMISIDTSKPEVMQQAVDAGANLVNDVYALRRAGAVEMVASLNVPVCLMHMQDDPATMQIKPTYQQVVDDVKAFFTERLKACEAAGITREKVLLDPGFGFGKTLQHNLSLLANLTEFEAFGCPLVVGLSRKSMWGELLGKEVNQRVSASVNAALLAIVNGASIVRVHDIAETRDALKIYNAVNNAN